jgi:prevent-host-death family protein
MKVVSMHQAKSTLSQLVHRAEQGEVIFIGAYGKPQAKIVSIDFESKKKKRLGVLSGKLDIPDGFDEPLAEDILDEFEESL